MNDSSQIEPPAVRGQPVHLRLPHSDAVDPCPTDHLLAASLALLISRYRGSESVIMCMEDLENPNAAASTPGVRLQIDDRLSAIAFIASIADQIDDGPIASVHAPTDELETAEVDWKVALHRVTRESDFEVFGKASLNPEIAVALVALQVDDDVRVRVFVRDGAMEAWMIEAIPAHLEQLWRQLAERGEAIVGRLAILTEEEYQRVVVDWNDTGVEEPVGTPIQDRFEENMARFGDLVAVIDGDRSLTYRELRSRANCLGRFLRRSGAGIDVPVAVFLERSIDLVVSIVGLQRAGSAYMPLDPAYPAERIRYQVEDSAVPIIVTNRRLAEKLPSGSARVVLIDEESETIAAESDAALKPGFSVGDVSNVFYTSGSTGKPKGVLMLHSLLTRAGGKKPAKRAETGQGMLLKSPVGFTLILLETNSSINSGGRLIVVPDGKEKDPAYLVRAIREHAVGAAGFVPSMLDLLLDDPEVGACHSLERISTVGESLPVDVQERFLEKLPHARLVVHYGCTEAPAATSRVISSDDDFGRRIVIGKPSSGKRIYILDKNRIPLPVGVAGEIFIGGTLSRGYLNRDELTSERFQDDPFSSIPGARVYQTGDLGRWLPDGSLEILGRTDFQVQVRGVRIELGEIEEALMSHPSVRDAIVHPEQKGGQVRLFAYVTSSEGGSVPVGELRQRLRERLPDYMLPAAIVEMDAFPLNAAGKVDRLALPKPEKIERNTESAFLGPRTPSEVWLCEMWTELLGVDRVGIEDDFLELGGDSFSAVRMLGRIQTEFGKRFELPDLFSDPRIVSLAALLDGKRQPTHLKWLIPTRFFDDSPPTHTFEGSFVFAYVTTKMMEGLNLRFPVYSISIDWKYSSMDYSEGVVELAAHHVEELISIDPEGPYRLAGYSFGGLVAYEMARQLVAMSRAVAFVVLLDPTPPFGSRGTSESDFIRGERRTPRSRADSKPRTAAQKLKSVPLRKRLGWIWVRRGAFVNRFNRVSARALQFLVVRGLWPGKKIPEALRKDWATLYKMAIWRRYRPGGYDGDVTVFTTEGRDSLAQDAWGGSVHGELTCEALPVRTHDDILSHPAALGRIAEHISSRLGNAPERGRVVENG